MKNGVEMNEEDLEKLENELTQVTMLSKLVQDKITEFGLNLKLKTVHNDQLDRSFNSLGNSRDELDRKYYKLYKKYKTKYLNLKNN